MDTVKNTFNLIIIILHRQSPIEFIRYMLLSRHQNVGQNRDIEIANRSL
jgi:hypothetical protein